MRTALLSWWSVPNSAPALSSSPLVSHLPSLLLPLPPPSFLAPPSLSDTLNTSAARPSLAEIVPLVLALQQYLLASLFRAPASDVSPADLAAQLVPVLSAPGGPVEWHALWVREGPRQELEGTERDGIARRLAAVMTGVFATVTKGCAGLDGHVGASHAPSLSVDCPERGRSR